MQCKYELIYIFIYCYGVSSQSYLITYFIIKMMSIKLLVTRNIGLLFLVSLLHPTYKYIHFRQHLYVHVVILLKV